MSLKTWLLDLLFPVECLGCGQEGNWLCETCLRNIKFSSLNKNGGGHQTSGLNAPALDKIFIAGDYNDPLLAAALKKFKYNFIPALGRPLGLFLTMFWQGQLALPENFQLAPRPNSDWADDNLLNNNSSNNKPAGPVSAGISLAPIPLSKKRLRWRGFNQAEILAEEISAAFGYSLSRDLKRKKHQAPQAGLGENERALNIQEAFSWTGGNLRGRTLILVDDVVTTGATLNEAARVLKAAGAGRVYGLVLAKG